MSPPAAPRWLPPEFDPLTRWGLAAGLFLAALALRLEVLGAAPGYPFSFFLPAVLLAAWIGGQAPGCTVALASTAAGWWFAIRPPGTLAWPHPADSLAIALFLASGILAALLIGGAAQAARAGLAAASRAQAALAGQRLGEVELQHRVANDLQLIASSLTQQGREIGGTAEAAALAAATRRLDALAHLYRRLLAAPDVAWLTETIEQLCRIQTEGATSVTAAVEVDPDLRLEPGQLTVLGLIASEAVSNARKHAFAPGRGGRLLVRLRAAGPRRAELEVRDNGPGLPPGFDVQHAQSLGLRIVQSLAHRLGGTLAMHNDRGAVLRVRFPAQAAAEEA